MSGTGVFHCGGRDEGRDRGVPAKVVRMRERWSGRGADYVCVLEDVATQEGQTCRLTTREKGVSP